MRGRHAAKDKQRQRRRPGERDDDCRPILSIRGLGRTTPRKDRSDQTDERRHQHMDHVVRLRDPQRLARSEEHTSELQSLMRISYAVFCLKKKKTKQTTNLT